MTRRSPIPGALDALVAFAQANKLDDAVEVSDGPPTNVEADLILIGYSSNPASVEAVTDQVSDSDAGRSQPLDVFDIACEASSWDGDADLKTVRDRTYSIVDSLSNAIDADPTLGGAIDGRAYVTDTPLIQDVTKKGAVATVPFTVRVEAWRQP